MSPCGNTWTRRLLVVESTSAPFAPVVEVGAVAHGGHCVARLDDGRVAFVRHALPGETVRLRITGAGKGGRFLRADAVEILSASPDRREPPCPFSGPAKCGGCDWQHVTLHGQRSLKAAVLAESLQRFARLSPDELSRFDLNPRMVAGQDEDGSGHGWRTRIRYAISDSGHIAMRKHRSHGVIEVDACPLGVPIVRDSDVGQRSWKRDEIEVVDDGHGDVLVASEGHAPQGRARVERQAAGRTWQVSGTGFWQVHQGAAQALVDVVGLMLEPQSGEKLLDLYSGVGLFAGAFASTLGLDGLVDAVEGSDRACADARRNLSDAPNVRLHNGDVHQWLTATSGDWDLVVLDPPRSGAGPAVMADVLQRGPRAVVYVACDPVALARDLADPLRAGWRLTALVALDMFPNTHHFETVVRLEPPMTSRKPG
jgi:tRNA/tmRNA/rRNA uracil-C5-methylase (TrmA/RlmC/RlmD family)